jgi:hypothetical protein
MNIAAKEKRSSLVYLSFSDEEKKYFIKSSTGLTFQASKKEKSFFLFSHKEVRVKTER